MIKPPPLVVVIDYFSLFFTKAAIWGILPLWLNSQSKIVHIMQHFA